MFQDFLPPEFLIFLEPFWRIIVNWWWLAVPLLLWGNLIYLYLYWRQEKWFGTLKMVFLEIKIPKEVLKPIRAMEHVFAGIHGMHDVMVWRERWIEGMFQLAVSFEIASIEGEVRFFIRTPQAFQQVLESNIYSQYPEAQIIEVDDYTKYVPQNIPNKDWDLFGFDMVNTKGGEENPYPIRTYMKFESEREAKEEKRIDPLAGLLEGMASLKSGEQLWVQIRAKPVRDEVPWVDKGRELINELVRRPKKPAPKPLLIEAADILITGKPPGAVPEEKEIIPPEMKLTPGEREIVSLIEEKITKFGFMSNIRYIYLGRKDVFFKPRARIAFGFFKEISYEKLGGIKPWKVTMPKVKTVPFWFLDKRREYMRKRRLFRRYRSRFTPLYPRPGGTYILNTEELATLYHFPGRIVAPAPAIPRIEAKKGEPPAGLPVEQ